MKIEIKYITKLILAIFFMINGVFADSHQVLKTNIPKYRIDRIEPDVQIQSTSRETCPAIYPMNVDDYTWFTLIDSSANGYGMVSSVTRPINVNFNAYTRHYDLSEVIQMDGKIIFNQFIPERTPTKISESFEIPEQNSHRLEICLIKNKPG